MTQSRIDSAMEVAVNIGIGLAIATAANAVVLPAVLGVEMSAGQNIGIAGIFTVISVVRQYVLRRLFNGRSPWMWARDRWERRRRRLRTDQVEDGLRRMKVQQQFKARWLQRSQAGRL